MKVFISYSHVDHETADSVGRLLSELKVEYFLDTKDVYWGGELTDLVKGGLRESNFVIMIISPASLKSQWVLFEVGYALGVGAKVLPFLTHPALEVPGYIRGLHYKTDLREVRTYFENETGKTDRKLSPEQARKRLELLGTEYNQKGFRERADAGDVEAVRLFLEAGIRTDIADHGGMMALSSAILRGHTEVAALLIQAGTNIDVVDSFTHMTPLSFAISRGMAQIAIDLISAGADVNARSRGKTGKTPLEYAVFFGSEKIVVALIDAGVDVNAGGNLIRALERRDFRIAQQLIRAGAELGAYHRGEPTPLMMAVESDSFETVQVLVEAGADVNDQDDSGDTALSIATRLGHDEITKFLLRSGATTSE